MNLPDELWETVFRSGVPSHTWRDVRQVCRCFNAILDRLATGLVVDVIAMSDASSFARLVERRPNVRRVWIVPDGWHSRRSIQARVAWLTGETSFSRPVFRARLSALTTVEIGGLDLRSIRMDLFPAIVNLHCDGNLLTSLDLSGCPRLAELDCANNRLERLDVGGCTALRCLDCDANRLAELDVTGCSALTSLNCARNALRRLSLASCPLLRCLDCSGNRIQELDLSGCRDLVLVASW